MMNAAQQQPLTEYLDGWRTLGSHEVRIDDDIVWIRPHGVVTGDEQRQLNAICNAMHQRVGYILVLSDVQDLTSMSPEARRVLNQEMRGSIVTSYTAIYGAKPWVRALAVLSQRAVHLITRKTLSMSFAAEESEARSILAAHRLALAAAPREPVATNSSAD